MKEYSLRFYRQTNDEHSFVFHHERLTPRELFPPHTHTEWELLLIVRGQGTLLLGGSLIPFAAGDVVVIPPDMIHDWRFDLTPEERSSTEPCEEDICLTIRNDLVAGVAALIPELAGLRTLLRTPQSALQLQGDTLRQVRQLLKEMVAMEEEGRFGAMMQLLRILARSEELQCAGSNRSLRKSEEKMHRIEEYVGLHYNRTLPLAEIAELVHMNRSSFCLFFRRMKGVSFSTWLTEYRIEAACRLLISTDRPITEVSECAGFNSPAHFSRLFSRLRGTSPSRFRRNHTTV